MTPADIVDVVHWIEEIFEDVRLRRSYGGALAYNFYAPPRLTVGVDVLVVVPALKAPSFIEQLRHAGCLHGEVNPRPIELRAVLDDLRRTATPAVFLHRGTRLELFTPWHPFDHRVLDRSVERELEGRRIRIHTAEDLVVYKKTFDRPKDLMDIKAILLAQKGGLDTARMLGDARDLLSDESWKELSDLVARLA